MARQSKEQKLIEIHQTAVKQFDSIQEVVREERRLCLEDRRFYSISGGQWEGSLGQQFENKPKFEVNKVHLAIIRIFNEYRNNRISTEFVSKDGNEYDKLAETLNNLYRADRIDSNAEEATDNAFEEGVGGGIGAWRLRQVWEDEDEEEKQRIAFEPIFDADTTVFFDLAARRQDKADARYCFVLNPMTVEDYEETYNDSPATWDKAITGSQFDWATPDIVYVAEYYKVEDVRETLRVFESLSGEKETYSEQDFENDPELEATLAATGYRELEPKKVKRKKVHKYLLSGNKVLSDEGYIAGRNIPIVPYYGKRWVVDNVERCMGHVRLAKDPQRLKNMQISKLGEISSLSSVEKPIFYPQQIMAHGVLWSEDNQKNNPYLLIDPIFDKEGNMQVAGAVDYTRTPAIPPAMAGLLQLTEQDIKDVLGNQEQGEKIVSNISGKAVDLIQNKLDMQTFIYTSNMAKSEKRCGEIWLSMAQEIYVEEGRKKKGIDENGKASMIELNRPIVNEDGEIEYENNISDAKFDVFVDVGPSSQSKRAATVRALTGMMAITQDAETMQVLSAMAMMNMEGEGIGDVRDFFRKKLLTIGAVKPTEEEQKQIMEAQMMAQNGQVDPNSMFLQAAAEEATAKAAKARAETIETVASANLKRAQADKVYNEMGMQQPQEQPMQQMAQPMMPAMPAQEMQQMPAQEQPQFMQPQQ